MPRFRADDLEVTTKPDLTPVSEADRAVEHALRDRIGAVTEHSVVGEEFDDLVGSDTDSRWILDPIDGTKNYVRGVPIWATLIGLEHAGELVVGVVSAPGLSMRWWAARGLGAFRNGESIHVSSVAALDDAQLSFAWDTLRSFEGGDIGPRLLDLSHRCWRTRGIGDFWQHMLVAEGAFDIAVDPIVSLWDVAALVPIVAEAGGRWSTVDGREEAAGGSFVCTNGRLHDDVLAALAAVASAAMSEITVGIDIGTSSVKAVAADADGNVVARSRIPHRFHVPSPLRFEHDAAEAWFAGPQRALEALGDIQPRAVSVAAMVPSLTAVDDAGVPVSPGLLYGDERGHGGERGDVAEIGELAQFLRWQVGQRPDARGYWMAQAVANHALTGEAVVSTTVGATAAPLVGHKGWHVDLVEATGARVDQMPAIAVSGQPVGQVQGYDDCVLEAGTIDAMAEQIVAGADEVGDVLAILGTTLIVWVVTPDPVEGSSYYCVPHTAPGARWLVGGPSNVGGLFLEWVARLSGEAGNDPSPHDVPLWVPYPRGERTPINDPARRAQIVDMNLTHGGAAIRRAAFEASGFVTRRIIDASPTPARRIVAVGGGTRVPGWVEAVADTTGLPVHVAAVPEGGALGAAFLARMAAGLETSTADAPRWARFDRVVDPDPAWIEPAGARYARFLEIAG